jgi:hypothetical protein
MAIKLENQEKPKKVKAEEKAKENGKKRPPTEQEEMFK